jgi:hypothetical protein
VLARLLSASTGRSNVFAREPWLSFWTPRSMGDLLARHGFTVTGDHNLLDVARELRTPVRHPASLVLSAVSVADRG